MFSAAFHLKELCESGVCQRLFELAYRKASRSKDLWWRVRALQELGWDDELRSILVQNRKAIGKSKNLELLALLHEATGETKKLELVRKKQAESENW